MSLFVSVCGRDQIPSAGEIRCHISSSPSVQIGFDDVFDCLCKCKNHCTQVDGQKSLDALAVLLSCRRFDPTRYRACGFNLALDFRNCANAQFHVDAVLAFLENGRVLDDPQAVIEVLWRMVGYYPLFLPLVASFMTPTQWRNVYADVAEKKTPHGHFPHLVALCYNYCRAFVEQSVLDEARARHDDDDEFDRFLTNPWNNLPRPLPSGYAFFAKRLDDARRICVENNDTISEMVAKEAETAQAAKPAESRSSDSNQDDSTWVLRRNRTKRIKRARDFDADAGQVVEAGNAQVAQVVEVVEVVEAETNF